MGELENELHHNGYFFSNNQWESKGVHPTRERPSTRLPLFTVFIHIVYRDLFQSFVSSREEATDGGFEICKEVTITHLLFADDSLIFLRASEADCRHLKRIFDCYAEASEQIFNFEKSSMVFSGKIPNAQITAIKDIFKLNVVSRHENYLGLPSMIGRKRTSFFKDIKLKILSKISSWHHKMFSSGGRNFSSK